MGNSERGKKVISGLIWTYGERALADFVSFIVSVILARILLPECYGVIALVTVFMTILQVFVTNGLSDYLIQKKEINYIDFSVVFWLNIIFACVIYLFIFLISPVAAQYYGLTELKIILRVMGLKILIAAFNSVQQAYICRTMDFKKFFKATSVGTILSAIVGIGLAYAGAEVWALIAQYLVNSLVDTIMLFLQAKWRPCFCFSLNKAKDIVIYGWKIVMCSLLGAFYGEFRTFIIGKRYNASSLAYYNYGKKLPRLIVDNISAAMGKVLFPTFSEMQNEKENFAFNVKMALKLNIYIITPILIGLAVIAPALIQVLLTDKWIESVYYVRVFCVCYISKPVTTMYAQALKALGENACLLAIQTVSMIANILIVLFAVFRLDSVEAIAMGVLLGTMLEILLYLFAVKRKINLKIGEQFRIILFNSLPALVMGVCVFFLEKINCFSYLLLVLQVVVGVIVYLLWSVIFRPDGYREVHKLIKLVTKR